MFNRGVVEKTMNGLRWRGDTLGDFAERRGRIHCLALHSKKRCGTALPHRGPKV